nr:MAG TPA: portal protein [Caudoviricetes sp.]
MQNMDTNKQIHSLEEEEKDKRAAFAAELKNALQFFDPENPPNRNTSTYSRESLRTYLRNPATDANNKSLRKLSNYLYTVSHVYRRMINYKAHQINCKTWTAYPVVNMIENNDDEAILKEYERVVNIVTNMHMETQIYKLMLSLWKNGVVFGYTYGDPESDGSFYIHVLDPDYCKISCASYDNGVLGFLFDVTYFNSHTEQLEYYDKEFDKLYREYQNDNIKWKQLPIERTICLKVDPDNLDYAIPPLSGLLEQIISLTDLQAAQDEIDSLQNYKMVWGKLDTISGTKSPDDFSVDLDLALAFMKKINAALPDNVAYALSPLDLDTIEFKDNDASDSNVLSKAYSNVIESNGSIIMNSNKITNSTAFKLAMKVECEDAMAPITQLNAWLKFYLKYNHNNEIVNVEYSDISPYFMNDEIEKYTKLAGFGLPLKTKLASMMNVNPQAQYGYDFLERQLLGLSINRWNNPLVSSAVQSGNPLDGEGAPTAEEKGEELSPEGEASRDKDTNQK